MIGDRIHELRTDAGMTQEAFGRIAGTSKQYVGRIEKGINTNPGPEFIRRWARHFRVRMEWLTSGELPKEAREIDNSDYWPDVRGYSQGLGLGSSEEASEYAETHSLKFRASSLSKKQLNPAQLAVMYGKGDSMLPRIHSGDAVLFDTTDTRPRDGKLFVIQLPGAGGNELQVKRCEVIDDLTFFRADNPDGDHTWRKPRRIDDRKTPIIIIGRVRWIGSWED